MLTWNTTNDGVPDLTDCLKQAVRPLPALLLAFAYLIGCSALLRSQRPPHLDDVGFSWLLFARLTVSVMYGAATVADLVFAVVSLNTFAYASIIQIVAPAIELFAVVVLVFVYMVEYSKLNFANPGTFTFWIVSFVYYAAYNYSAWLNVAKETGRVPLFTALMGAVHLLMAVFGLLLMCMSQLEHLPGDRSPYALNECRQEKVRPAPRTAAATGTQVTVIETRAVSYGSSTPTSSQVAPEGPPLTVIRKPCPERVASHASYLTFFWFFKLVVKGFRKPLEAVDLWLLRREETTEANHELFAPVWDEELKKWFTLQEQQERLASAQALPTSTSTPKAPSRSEIELGQMNTAYNREPEVGFRNGKAGAGPSSDKKEANGVKNNGEIDAGAGATSEAAAPPEAEPDDEVPPFTKTLLKVYGWPLLVSQLVMLGYAILLYANPMLLWAMTDFMLYSELPEWRGYAIGLLFFLACFVQPFFSNSMYHLVSKVGIRFRAAIIDTIYRKALRIAASASTGAGGSSTGQIVNLLAVDLQRLQDVLQFLWMVWYAPLNIIIAMVLLYQQIKWVAFVGLGIMFFAVIINGFVASFFRILQIKLMTFKDKRVKFMTELLNGIKVVKLYAWEQAFGRVVYTHRDREVPVLFQFFLLSAILFTIFTVMPFFVTAATLLIYSRQVNPDEMKPSTVFVSLALIQMLQAPLSMLPLAVGFIAGSMVALKRIARFLSLAEVKPDAVTNVVDEVTKKYPIIIENASFSWKAKGLPVLRDINLRVKKGELVAVVGTVGSGKSSLVATLLGDMEKLSGRVNVASKKIAYVAQAAWIQNATLRENILFGCPYDEERYAATLDACALRPDLAILGAGDMTEIGERGINLSGGQKQRVAVARAVYSDADIFVLDDPLSAVDVHVGKHLFDRVIGPGGLLAKRGATRVLVTHGIHYLPNVDRVLCLADGAIREQGTYRELITANSHFAELIRNFQSEQEDEDDGNEDGESEASQEEGAMGKIEAIDESEELKPRQASIGETGASGAPHPTHRQRSRISEMSSGSGGAGAEGGGLRKRTTSRQRSTSVVREKGGAMAKADDKRDMSKAKLTDDEESAIGHVKFSVYWWYWKAQGLPMFAIFGVLFLIYQGVQIFANIWLSRMSNKEEIEEELSHIVVGNGSYVDEVRVVMRRRIDRFLWVYFGLGFVQALFMLCYNTVFSFMAVKACKHIHVQLLERLIRAPMSFFDTTPTGRILNRFTKDLDVIDFLLPGTFRAFVMMLGQLVSVFVVITYSTWQFLALLIPVMLLFGALMVFYLPTSRQLRRVESTSRSPVFSLISETISGRSTVHAFCAESRFIAEQARRTDDNHVFNWASMVANRLLGFYVDMANCLLVTGAAVFAALGRNGAVDSGVAGLSLSYAMQISGVSNFMVRMLNELEVNSVSIERAKEYTEIPSEAAWSVPATRPPPQWPNAGNIQFLGYQTRYREGLDLVLKGLSFNVAPSEKVGICGRTGAGKSSLTLALFRLVEATGGRIIIDGIPIERLGLHDLRSRLTILPQDPVIFSGTLRFNLDPFKQHTDEEVWRALELVHLKTHFMEAVSDANADSKGLGFEVSEGGGNLSVGQRQLLCLARALLRRTKVLVLDEATAAVDYETDSLIQATIRSEFRDCTVLTIAHRINTIMDANKIMVLDQGYMREYDSPANLLSLGPACIFFQMVQQAGLSTIPSTTVPTTSFNIPVTANQL